MRNAALFFLFFLLQIFVFEEIHLFELAYPKAMILYLLFLPLSLNLSLQYLIAFFFGILIGLYVNTLGVHAFSGVLLISLRNFWIQAITPQLSAKGGKDALDLEAQTLSWQFTYIVPLVFLFEIVFNILGDFSFTTRTLFKIIASGLYSSAICYLLAIFFYRKNENKTS